MGRAAVSYLAPDPLLSTSPEDPTAAAQELQAMVAGLHEAGVEVIVQVGLRSPDPPPVHSLTWPGLA